MRLKEVLEEALRLAKPPPREEEELKETVNLLLRETRAEAEKTEGAVNVSLEGSAAKGTWVKGRAEADIFIHFEPTVPKERMEREIVELGFRVLERLKGRPRLMYADHPYVEGRVGEVTVNIVACYRVEPPGWLSATDRTPYHTRYVLERLGAEQRDQVRLLKAFMLGCGVYGAEIKVRGFSGYLAELLILHYGSFPGLVEAASKWKPPIILDLEGHYRSAREAAEAFPGQPLVVIDPVDRARNVAAAVAEERLAEFILASKLFLRSPSLRFFGAGPKPRRPSLTQLARGRNILAVSFRTGVKKPPDVLWGELRRSGEGVKRALERLGFQVYRSGAWTDEEKECLLVYELAYLRLPPTRLHRGPPAHHPNALQFIEKWVRSRERAAGPWVEGMRLYVLRREGMTDAVKLLKREVLEGRVALARGLIDEIKQAKITTQVTRLARNRRLQRYLREFLSARPTYL